MVYSLADYIMTIALPASVAAEFGVDSISIGGEGSYVGSISVKRNKKTYEVAGDDTGSWVYNKSYNKTGTVTVSLNQLAPHISTLKNLFKLYEKSSTITEGLTVQISTVENTICVCNDCYINGVPDQDFEDSAKEQSWELDCGQVLYE